LSDGEGLCLQRKEEWVAESVVTVLYLLIDTLALTVYFDPVSQGNLGWPASVIVDGVPDIENITDALQNGPYGKCVYESSNDVCDQQVHCAYCFMSHLNRQWVTNRW
jgi:hypothetical protein